MRVEPPNDRGDRTSWTLLSPGEVVATKSVLTVPHVWVREGRRPGGRRTLSTRKSGGCFRRKRLHLGNPVCAPLGRVLLSRSPREALRPNRGPWDCVPPAPPAEGPGSTFLHSPSCPPDFLGVQDVIRKELDELFLKTSQLRNVIFWGSVLFSETLKTR